MARQKGEKKHSVKCRMGTEFSTCRNEGQQRTTANEGSLALSGCVPDAGCRAECPAQRLAAASQWPVPILLVESLRLRVRNWISVPQGFSLLGRGASSLCPSSRSRPWGSVMQSGLRQVTVYWEEGVKGGKKAFRVLKNHALVFPRQHLGGEDTPSGENTGP